MQISYSILIKIDEEVNKMRASKTGRELGKLAVFTCKQMLQKKKPKRKPLAEHLFGETACMAWKMRKK
jgi:hypothetical protein